MENHERESYIGKGYKRWKPTSCCRWKKGEIITNFPIISSYFYPLALGERNENTRKGDFGTMNHFLSSTCSEYFQHFPAFFHSSPVFSVLKSTKSSTKFNPLNTRRFIHFPLFIIFISPEGSFLFTSYGVLFSSLVSLAELLSHFL